MIILYRLAVKMYFCWAFNAKFSACWKQAADVFIKMLFIAARQREDSISSTYDTFVPNKIDRLQQLIELQQRVKAGTLTVDEALERFSDWQGVQKSMDATQQVALSSYQTVTLDQTQI